MRNRTKIFIFPTFVCTLNCPRCYQRRLRPPYDYSMSARQFQRIVERIESLDIRHREWVFTGGEPTCWPDLTWAIGLVKQYRRTKVRVVSNGYERQISDYGGADVIQISDYGAINRMDQYRLRKQGDRRMRIQTAVHCSWDGKARSELPGSCGCNGLAFVGDKVWPCAMAAAARTADGMNIEEDFKDFMQPEAAWYQDLCASCLVNRKNRKAPKPVLQISVWEAGSAIFG